jgi:threonine/homoserine/homoserine lactone efflux protein
MDVFLHGIFGFGVGFIGVIPPGLLNMTAAKISVKQNRRAARMFALGASLVVIAQVYVGVFFSKILNENPDILELMEQFAIAVFIALSIFFFIKTRTDEGPEVEPTENSDTKLFSQGIILSALNIFPIPFYIGFSSFLASRGLFSFRFPTAHVFIAGATLGTFIMLLAYANLVRIFNFNSRTFARKVHYMLAVLTLLVAFFTLLKLYL